MNENNSNALNEINAQTKQLQQNVANLNEVLVSLDKLQDDVGEAIAKNTKNLKDYGSQITSTTAALKGLNEQASKISQIFNTAQTSIQQNFSSLQLLTQMQVNYSKTQADGITVTENLSVKVASLTQSIQEQQTQVEKSKEKFDFQKAAIDALNSSFDKIKASNKDFGPVLEDATKGFNVMKDGISAVKTGFTSLDGVLKTSAFGAFLFILESVVEYFTKTTEGARKLKIGIAAISSVINTIKTGISKVLSTIGKNIVDAFSHPAKTIENIWNAVLANLKNRFSAIGDFFDGLFSGNLKKMGNAVIQMGTGVTDGIDKALDAAKKVEGAIVKTYEKASEAAKKTDALQNKLYENETKKGNGAKSLKFSNPHKAIQAQAEHFAQPVETAKKQYAINKANFDKQLDAQLISQQEHNDLSKQLQDKFMADMRTNIGVFSEENIAETIQNQKELVKAQQLEADQHDVEKAFTPSQQLAAEKKMIEDKYNFEIQQANEAGRDTSLIRMRYAQEVADAEKKMAQERKDFELKTTQEVSNAAFSILQNSIKSQSEAKIKQLETQKASELNNSSLTATQKKAIEDKYTKKEAEEKTKTFKAEQRASMLQAVINGALAITKATSQTGVLAPFVIPGIIAETAIQVATIAAQKAPQYAKGGVHYQSDGRGALLPGYSRTDNMNAHLRSGEAVVVSEAMRDPWARNLVSAINVAYGGRDFSIANPNRGYAIGGIFTDGGNSNRYYNQPVNDQKDLANTIAYQMINNFPPVYVDVKDINNQQNILAQTINRVNL